MKKRTQLHGCGKFCFSISPNKIAEWSIIHDTIKKKIITCICTFSFRGVFFAFIIPEIFAFFRALRVCLVRHVHKPKILDFLVIFTFETFHVAGVAILFYSALPYMDSPRALMSAR